MERNGGAPIIGELLMPGGELLKQQGMQEYIQGVLQTAYRAGVEVIRDGKISKETEKQIQKPLLAPDELAEMANLWWDSHLEGITQGKLAQGKVEDMRLLLRGMAVAFNSQAAGDLRAAIQFEVTGKQTGDWFLSIESGKCMYHEGKTNAPNITIRTPSEVWLAIANNEMDGQQAFMEGKYQATGDMSLLMRMRSLFGSGTS
jgi:putative sterol carrier protein